MCSSDLDELTNGNTININMHAESLITINNQNIKAIQVISQYVTSFELSVNHRWNMVSVPLHVEDFRKTSVYPMAISPAYAFLNGIYVAKDTLDLGVGYWLKFSSDKNTIITGIPNIIDTINVNEGWNMIGGLSVPIAVSSIIQIPSSIVFPNYFGYNNGYFAADTLRVGKSYWVKVSQNGKLILKVNN